MNVPMALTCDSVAGWFAQPKGHRRKSLPTFVDVGTDFRRWPLAVAVGFEPTEAFTSHAFEACSFGRSDTPPPRTIQDGCPGLSRGLPVELVLEAGDALGGVVAHVVGGFLGVALDLIGLAFDAEGLVAGLLADLLLDL